MTVEKYKRLVLLLCLLVTWTIYKLLHFISITKTKQKKQPIVTSFLSHLQNIYHSQGGGTITYQNNLWISCTFRKFATPLKFIYKNVMYLSYWEINLIFTLSAYRKIMKTAIIK